jgi:CubicO group peptidase (beta-lactamase class C family)
MRHDSHIRSIAEPLVAQGDERVLQIAAVRNDEVIVNITVGAEDDALFPVFSASKGVTALVALRFVERGLITYDTPIADVWPEFAANGKADIRLGEVLSHTAGLAECPAVTTFEEFCDWETMVRAVAELRPVGRGRPRYHALTYGWLVGEALRRAAGGHRGFGDIMRAELFSDGPADFWFGIPEEVENRIVPVARDVEPVDDRPLSLALPARFGTTQSVYGRGDVRRACLPAVNGVGNALSLAWLYARAASGKLAGAGVLAEATQLRSHGIDELMESYVARSYGFYVSAAAGDDCEPPFDSGELRFGHPGAGGTLAWGDRRTGAGFAICRSRLTGNGWRHRNIQRLVAALIEAAQP